MSKQRGHVIYKNQVSNNFFLSCISMQYWPVFRMATIAEQKNKILFCLHAVRYICGLCVGYKYLWTVSNPKEKTFCEVGYGCYIIVATKIWQ